MIIKENYKTVQIFDNWVYYLAIPQNILLLIIIIYYANDKISNSNQFLETKEQIIAVSILIFIYKVIYKAGTTKYLYAFEILLSELSHKVKELNKDRELYSIDEIKEILGYKESNLKLLERKLKE